jgi:hypothetical protein
MKELAVPTTPRANSEVLRSFMITSSRGGAIRKSE